MRVLATIRCRPGAAHELRDPGDVPVLLDGEERSSLRGVAKVVVCSNQAENARSEGVRIASILLWQTKASSIQVVS